MQTITVHPEHLDGLCTLAQLEFETACEEHDVSRLRHLIALDDQIGWSGFESDRPPAGDVRMPDVLLEKFVAAAWQVGNERLSDLYGARTQGEPLPETYSESLERRARSMLAFHEHAQAERVAG